jgi:alkanesulfonate monooxygenase SsuD/methylene tetrahydromethanopterin reductase-like flavin-dependent oxidoreductase (luciferase family)
VQFHLYLPQMRVTPADVVVRARAAEANGFGGIALMDHLAPPLAEAQTMWEAMTLATWVAAHTERLTIGHLVLCDAFRHPAQLAREALTIDHASGGRFELGLGSGSVPAEFRRFGFDTGNAATRLERLAETLEVLRLLWTGGVVDHPGPRFPLDGAQQLPVPTGGRLPIILGGTAPRLLELVGEYADWWSVPPGQLHRLEELRPIAGDRARVSVLEMFTLLPAAGGDAVEATARRRFGHLGDTHVIGDAASIRRHVAELRDRGVERIYTWFSDFADPAGLEAFGNDVIAGLSA